MSCISSSPPAIFTEGLTQAFFCWLQTAGYQNGISSSKSIGGSLLVAGALFCAGRDCCWPPLNWLPPCGC